MSNRKLKMTGFARFFLAMIIIAPLAYLGASYINGEDGIQNVKDIINIDTKKEVMSSTDEIDQLMMKLENCSQKNRELEKELAIKNALLEQYQSR